MANSSSPDLARETVGSLVRRALGSRAARLSDAEIHALVRRFVAAGRAEVRLAAGTASDAARAAMRAGSVREKALETLGDRTAPGYSDVLVRPSWRRERQALERARDRLDERDEVVGYGLGYRRRGGEEDAGEKVVTLFVDEKVADADLEGAGRTPLPASLRPARGRAVPVDVVEVGPLELQVLPGTSIGPDDNRILKGTIGAFATDLDTAEDVAITAMHVVAAGGLFTAPAERDDPEAADLGRFLAGTTEGVDAAKVSVDPPAFAETFLPGIGDIAGWRPLIHPDDRGARVRTFGATSGYRVGFIIEPLAALPRYGLDPVILVDIESADGDSGATIVDDRNLVLGTLVGQMPMDGFPVRVYSPISAALAALGCDF